MITSNQTKTHDTTLYQPDYQLTLANLRNRFTALSLQHQDLFSTDATGLYDAYLAGFPDATGKQHHTCTACRKFIETFGAAVFIGPDGNTIPAMWAGMCAIGVYQSPVSALERIVQHAKVTGVFLRSEKVWGQPVTGPWTHYAITPDHGMVWRGTVTTASQAEAVKLQDYLTVLTALKEFPLAAVEQAVVILQSDALYRSEKCLGAAKWLRELHQVRDADRKHRDNLTWKAIAAAPAGFCHPRTSMIGTLLEDIVAGLPFDVISQRFSEKMNPLQYQRPQAAPSAGNIAQAEKLVETMGIKSALRRRFARLDEIRPLWTPAKPTAPAASNGVFAHLKPKETPVVPAVTLPMQTMTWVKFASQVLPGATSMLLHVPVVGNFSALITAVDPDAPPILQWDLPEDRNPVSWYVYPGGSAATRWSLKPSAWVPVTAIALQPSAWGSAPMSHQGQSVFLLLEGAKDTPMSGLGLFPEILKAELHLIRATIEAFSQAGKIEGIEEATACGLRLQYNTQFDCQVRVNGGLTYKIDRWD